MAVYVSEWLDVSMPNTSQEVLALLYTGLFLCLLPAQTSGLFSGLSLGLQSLGGVYTLYLFCRCTQSHLPLAASICAPAHLYTTRIS
ncbi:hypothetical protein XENTR_v10019076 [Xenopus tropicalis]|nr:hypothetical protein XENTR_v10019076 [Xenopus tropicalis]